MRIAFVSTIRSAPWGGSEELWFLSAKAALSVGHTVGIFVYDWGEDAPKLKALRDGGAFIYKRKRSASLRRRILSRAAGGLGVGDGQFLNPYKALRDFNADCVAVTDGSTWYAADDPRLRELLLQHYPGRYIIVCQGNGAYNFPADRARAITFFQKAKKIVFVAEENRQQAFHQLAQRLENTTVIQNPVNLATLEPMSQPEARDGLIHLAMIGRLAVGDKGQDIVIAMMSEERWRNSPVRIHIYGKGADENYIRSLVAFYGLHDKVFIEGHTAVNDIWKKCHALVMPSILEGTPLTLLEAMVLGRVCIVTRVGGNEEWIVDGRNGFLVEAPTRALFSAKLQEAIDKISLWPGIATIAHEDAIEKMDKTPGDTLLKEILYTPA